MSSAAAKSAVFHGDARLGEVDVHPAHPPNFAFPGNEIRIDRISHPSERCPPLAVLLTLSPFSVRCKLDAGAVSDQPLLSSFYSSCIFDPPKTAVVMVEDEELHLVAMRSGNDEKLVCFWCCSVPAGLYDSCLGLLNQRCLAIVFDLDETLIVANTMKSFEDRIEFLQRRIACETDLLRASGMKAELKRYLEDKALLKQYSENDQVTDSGKFVKAQIEEVPSFSNNQNRVLRPIIRFPEKNIVLTRINPEIRDTSVLVRLRHAWEDLRSYLTAKGRKRFEVYVCTMAEREYALEMWRLLDPESHLISSKQLADRIACVKSGSRKSLLDVFQDGYCHPKMAMVIDDRLNVWEDCDQPRVHVVPPFAPYYAPQAETANAVPVLRVARNVACNVRGGFFKEFDEALLLRISELRYEDQIEDLPAAPDVSNYVMTEDMGFVLNGNGNRDVNIPEGMSGAEVERRLNQPDQQGGILDSSSVVPSNLIDVRPDPSRVSIVASSHLKAPLMPRQSSPVQGPGLLGAAPSEGEVTQSEIERRRLLVYQHGQDLRNDGLIDPPLITRPQKSMTTLPQRRGGWLVMEDNNADAAGSLSQIHPAPAGKAEEPLQVCVANGRDRQHSVGSTQATSSDDDVPRVTDGSNDDGIIAQASIVSVDVLREIGKRCKSTVEFRPIATGSDDLHFSFEVLFTGEKIGCGTGKTRKEARLQAANNALHYLAQKYMSHIEHDYALTDDKNGCSALQSENGFLMDGTDSSKMGPLVKKDTGTSLSTSDLEDSSREKGVVITPEEAFVNSKSKINPQNLESLSSPRFIQRVPANHSKDVSQV